MDANGNHTVQKCLLLLEPPELKTLVIDEITKNCIRICTDRHGCCVVQRTIDAATEEERLKLVARLIARARMLMQDPYGNYVIQYVQRQRAGVLNRATPPARLIFRSQRKCAQIHH